MKSTVLVILSISTLVKAQVTPLVAQLKDLQAEALGKAELSSPSNAPHLKPFIAPLHHPMFPSRPTEAPSLASKVPPEVCQNNCSILDLLVFNRDFSIFVSMLKLSDLIQLLSTEGPVTIFAPTNEAFDGLPTPLFKVGKSSLKTTFRPTEHFQSLLTDPEELKLTMLRHMTKGGLTSERFPEGSTPLVTGAGERLTLTKFPNQVTISSSLAVGNMIEVDNEASNGVVHVIDIVL